MKLLSALEISKNLELLSNIQLKYKNIHFLLHKDNIRLDLHIIKHIDEAFELPLNTLLYLCQDTIKKSEYIDLFYDMLDNYVKSFNINERDKYVLIINGIFKTSLGYEFKCTHIQLPNQKTLCYVKEI